jgi:predicted nucleotidyltransferase
MRIVMSKQDVIIAITKVLRMNGVRRASLFGSTAREEETAASDIDLLVELDSGKSLLDLVGIKLDLEEVLQREVDVLTYDSIHPLMKDQILREQEQIYEA